MLLREYSIVISIALITTTVPSNQLNLSLIQCLIPSPSNFTKISKQKNAKKNRLRFSRIYCVCNDKLSCVKPSTTVLARITKNEDTLKALELITRYERPNILLFLALRSSSVSMMYLTILDQILSIMLFLISRLLNLAKKNCFTFF